MGGPTPDTTRRVDERDQWRCVRCGRFIDGGSRHHRKLRRFGDHTPAAIILLCGSGTTGCHGWVHAHPALAHESGWLLRSWEDPTEVPVRYLDGLFRLTVDGRREPVRERPEDGLDSAGSDPSGQQ